MIFFFPFLSPFKRQIGKTLMNLVPYAQFSLNQLLSAALEEAPAPEEVCANLFKKPALEREEAKRIADLSGSEDPLSKRTPIELTRISLKFIVSELRKEKGEIEGVSLRKVKKRVVVRLKLLLAVFLSHFLPWYLRKREKKSHEFSTVPVESTIRRLVRSAMDAKWKEIDHPTTKEGVS
jgi:hypothetical protein